MSESWIELSIICWDLKGVNCRVDKKLPINTSTIYCFHCSCFLGEESSPVGALWGETVPVGDFVWQNTAWQSPSKRICSSSLGRNLEVHKLSLQAAETGVGSPLAWFWTKSQQQGWWSRTTRRGGRNQQYHNHSCLVFNLVGHIETNWDKAYIHRDKEHLRSETRCYTTTEQPEHSLISTKNLCCDHQTGRTHRLGRFMETVWGRIWTRWHHRWWNPNFELHYWDHSDDEDKWCFLAWVEWLLAAVCSSSGGRRRVSQELEFLLGILSAD